MENDDILSVSYFPFTPKLKIAKELFEAGLPLITTLTFKTLDSLATSCQMYQMHRYRVVRYLYCSCISGVNLLIGTDSGLMLLDRSGQGKGV